MAGLKRLKRVSWPTGGNLCEVRFFISDDAPSLSGLGSQDHLQAKSAWLLHTEGSVDSDHSRPPGFEAPQIPLIKWQCPTGVALNPDWGVVAGEESEEVAVEEERQGGVLEAVYPRPSSIPPNPYVAPEVQLAVVDDSDTPLIPLTDVEDEAVNDQSDALTASNSEPVQLQSALPKVEAPQLTTDDPRYNPEFPEQSNRQLGSVSPSEQPPFSSAVPAAEPDVLAAASLAFTAIMMSSEAGNMVDRDLLIEILKNPSMLDKLKQTTSASPPQPVSPPPPQPVSPSYLPTQIASLASVIPPPTPLLSTLNAPMSAPPAMSLAPFLHMPVAPPPVKDENYYKSLIKLHGGDEQKREPLKPQKQQHTERFSSNLGNMVVGYHDKVRGMSSKRDSTGKVVKQCAYFTTPGGCWRGSRCHFQHGASSSVPQWMELQKGDTKRTRFDRGIPAGRY